MKYKDMVFDLHSPILLESRTLIESRLENEIIELIKIPINPMTKTEFIEFTDGMFLFENMVLFFSSGAEVSKESFIEYLDNDVFSDTVISYIYDTYEVYFIKSLLSYPDKTTFILLGYDSSGVYVCQT